MDIALYVLAALLIVGGLVGAVLPASLCHDTPALATWLARSASAGRR